MKTWQERFDEKFHVIEYEQDGEIHYGFSYFRSPAAKEIKQFISQELKTLLDEFEKIVNIKNYVDENTERPYPFEDEFAWGRESTRELQRSKLTALRKTL